MPTLDLSSGSVEDLTARLLIYAKIQNTSEQLKECHDSDHTCSPQHECKMVNRQSCETCDAIPTATCLHKLDTAPVTLNKTASVVEPHSPSKATETLQRRARGSKRPILVQAVSYDPVIILDYDHVPLFNNDNAISLLLGNQVVRKKDAMVGPNYSLVLNRHSQCRHLPSSHNLAMVYADPISNILNHQLGKDLGTNTKQRSGVAHSRMFDGTTRVFLYHFTSSL